MVEQYQVTEHRLLDLTGAPKNAELQEAILKTYYYVRDHKKILCSVSGGYDSDIMLDMIERCGGHGKTAYVFNDTGLEYEATKRHLHELEKSYSIEIMYLKPKKPIPVCIKTYGVPFWSKYVSQMISRLQKHGFTWEDKPFEVLYRQYPRNKSSLRWWCNDFKSVKGGVSRFNIEYVRGLKEFMISNPPNFAISPKCCDYAKKNPTHDYLKAGGFDLNCVGVRRCEGGARATAYTSCYDKGWYEADQYRPLFWTTDREKDIYRAHYGIRRSDCYEVWGMKRTGCAGCPFGKDFEQELLLTERYEPNMNRAMKALFGESYDYTRRYLEFRRQMKEE